MIRSLVAMLLLGLVVMPEHRRCVPIPEVGACRWCDTCNACNWAGICCGQGRVETTYGQLLRGYVPEECEAQ